MPSVFSHCSMDPRLRGDDGNQYVPILTLSTVGVAGRLSP